MPMSPAAGLSPSTYCPKADVESTFYRAQSFAGLAQRFGRLKCGGPMLDPVLSPLLGPLFATLFDPSAYQGIAQAFIDRLIASART
jgi:hypothetical protein